MSSLLADLLRSRFTRYTELEGGLLTARLTTTGKLSRVPLSRSMRFATLPFRAGGTLKYRVNADACRAADLSAAVGTRTMPLLLGFFAKAARHCSIVFANMSRVSSATLSRCACNSPSAIRLYLVRLNSDT